MRLYLSEGSNASQNRFPDNPGKVLWDLYTYAAALSYAGFSTLSKAFEKFPYCAFKAKTSHLIIPSPSP